MLIFTFVNDPFGGYWALIKREPVLDALAGLKG